MKEEKVSNRERKEGHRAVGEAKALKTSPATLPRVPQGTGKKRRVCEERPGRNWGSFSARPCTPSTVARVILGVWGGAGK